MVNTRSLLLKIVFQCVSLAVQPSRSECDYFFNESSLGLAIFLHYTNNQSYTPPPLTLPTPFCPHSSDTKGKNNGIRRLSKPNSKRENVQHVDTKQTQSHRDCRAPSDPISTKADLIPNKCVMAITPITMSPLFNITFWLNKEYKSMLRKNNNNRVQLETC